jgi:hypothetical protein
MAMLSAWSAWYHLKQINFFPQKGWSTSELNSLPAFNKIQYLWFQSHAAAIARTIVGPPESFDANYADYQRLFTLYGFDEGMAEYQAKWKEIFDKYIRQYWR